MTKQITFELRQDYFDYGKADFKHGIFDTNYLQRSADVSLSYLAGWQEENQAQAVTNAQNTPNYYSATLYTRTKII